MEPVRFSHLRAYGRSPMHGLAARTKTEDKSTAAMLLGTAVHALVLGTQPVVAYPGAVRRGKEWDAFAAEHEGSLILTRNDYDRADAMANAVGASKVAQPYLFGKYEKTITFDWMGLPCRATPDIRGAGFITELKTAATSDPLRFPWQARKMAYHAQMRMQQIAAQESGPCYIICVESSAPHPVTVYRVTDELLLQGEKLLVLWAETLRNCEASKHWPGYSECVVPIDALDDEDTLVFEGDDDA